MAGTMHTDYALFKYSNSVSMESGLDGRNNTLSWRKVEEAEILSQWSPA